MGPMQGRFSCGAIKEGAHNPANSAQGNLPRPISNSNVSLTHWTFCCLGIYQIYLKITLHISSLASALLVHLSSFLAGLGKSLVLATQTMPMLLRISGLSSFFAV
jgi:hypothetical protein